MFIRPNQWAALMFLAIFQTDASAQPTSRFAVYGLAIGSTNYARPPGEDLHGLTRIDGANQSARLVADRLSRGGARFVLTLTSGPDTFVSLTDIWAALGNLTKQLAGDHPRHPLLIVYFAGHGMAEGVGWSHFSIPRDMVYRGDPEALRVDALAAGTLSAAALVDQLEKLKTPYLVVLDTCSEGSPVRFDSPVLSAQASANLGAVVAILRTVNQFRQANPVVFSAEPGQVVQVAPDPTNPDKNLIAPLARRFLLVVDPASTRGQALTLADLTKGLTAASLDNKTQPGVTHAILGAAANQIVVQPGSLSGMSMTMPGSATRATECCNLASVPSLSASLQFRGSLVVHGSNGEFLSGGMTQTLLTPQVVLTLEEDGGDITVRAGGELNGWTLNFAPPRNKVLGIGAYAQAERDSFQAADRPGLAITAGAKACNTVVGDFTINELHRDSTGKIDRLSAVFHHRCDDNAALLTIKIHLQRP